MHLGRADTAYGYGLCNIHVAYITRSSWDINIYLKTTILYCTSTMLDSNSFLIGQSRLVTGVIIYRAAPFLLTSPGEE